MNGNPRERNSAVHRAVDGLERFIEHGQASVAIAVGIGLILIQIPGIQDVAEKIGLDSSRELLIAVGALLLTSILLELRQLKRKVSPVITGRQHYSDQNEMYNALREKAGRLTDPEQFKLDVPWADPVQRLAADRILPRGSSRGQLDRQACDAGREGDGCPPVGA